MVTYRYNTSGKMLVVSGKMAVSADCCCGIDCQDILDGCPPEWFPSSITISGMDKCPCLDVVNTVCGFGCPTGDDPPELVVGDDFVLEQRCDANSVVFASTTGGTKAFYIDLQSGDCADVLDDPEPNPVDRPCVGVAIRLRLRCDLDPKVWALEINTNLGGCPGEYGEEWLRYERDYDPNDANGGLFGVYDCTFNGCGTASGSVTIS